MGVRASKVQERKPRTFTANLAEGPLSVTYVQQGISPKFLRELDSVQSHDQLVATIVEVVDEWDLLDDDDQPLPTTIEVVEVQPADFLARVLHAIGEDVVGGKARTGGRAGSANGSSPTGSTGVVPTGTP